MEEEAALVAPAVFTPISTGTRLTSRLTALRTTIQKAYGIMLSSGEIDGPSSVGETNGVVTMSETNGVVTTSETNGVITMSETTEVTTANETIDDANGQANSLFPDSLLKDSYFLSLLKLFPEWEGVSKVSMKQLRVDDATRHARGAKRGGHRRQSGEEASLQHLRWRGLLRDLPPLPRSNPRMHRVRSDRPRLLRPRDGDEDPLEVSAVPETRRVGLLHLRKGDGIPDRGRGDFRSSGSRGLSVDDAAGVADAKRVFRSSGAASSLLRRGGERRLRHLQETRWRAPLLSAELSSPLPRRLRRGHVVAVLRGNDGAGLLLRVLSGPPDAHSADRRQPRSLPSDPHHSL